MNLYPKKAYLPFLLRSFHLHGIHSPFVFGLSNACFSGKKEEFLPRLIDYLKIETVLFFGNTSKAIPFKTSKTSILDPKNPQELNSFLSKNQPFDLIYFPAQIENKEALFQKTLPLAHNDSVFVFENMHGSKKSEKAWEQIKRHPKTRVSIDTFDVGLVFFRKEQAKEDFSVRVGI